MWHNGIFLTLEILSGFLNESYNNNQFFQGNLPLTQIACSYVFASILDVISVSRKNVLHLDEMENTCSFSAADIAPFFIG